MRSSETAAELRQTARYTSSRLTLIALACIVTVGPVFGQDDASRVSKEREALRRTQAALRQSQEAQSALAKDKADLAVQRDQASETARRTQSQLSVLRADSVRAQSRLAQLQVELDAARAQAEAQTQESRARSDGLSQRVAQADRLIEERTRANAALTALLEFAAKSLTTAEKANREMYALGRQMIDQLRGKQPVPGVTVIDPVLGFDSIHIENHAEALRDRLEAAKLPASGAR